MPCSFLHFVHSICYQILFLIFHFLRSLHSSFPSFSYLNPMFPIARLLPCAPFHFSFVGFPFFRIPLLSTLKCCSTYLCRKMIVFLKRYTLQNAILFYLIMNCSSFPWVIFPILIIPKHFTTLFWNSFPQRITFQLHPLWYKSVHLLILKHCPLSDS